MAEIDWAAIKKFMDRALAFPTQLEVKVFVPDIHQQITVTLPPSYSDDFLKRLPFYDAVVEEVPLYNRELVSKVNRVYVRSSRFGGGDANVLTATSDGNSIFWPPQGSEGEEVEVFEHGKPVALFRLTNEKWEPVVDLNA